MSTMSAFTTPSGGYTLVQRRAEAQDTRAAAVSGWLSAGAKLGVGVGLLVVAALLAIIYALVAGLHGPSPGVRSLLVASTTAVAVIAGQVLIAAWRDCTERRRQREVCGALQALTNTVARSSAGHQQALENLADLPRQVRLLMEHHQIQQTEILSTVQGELGQLRDAMGERLAELERTVEQATQAEEILRRSRDGAQVVPFGPRGA